MHVLLLYRVDRDSDKVCKLNIGEHVIGRGPLLECTSKKVSRNHGLIRVTQNDGAFLVSTHHNPCFLQSSNTKHLTVVKNGTTVSICDGDRIALLPDEYWFRVQYVEFVNNENNNVSQRQVTEAPNGVQTDISTNNITKQQEPTENDTIGRKREHCRTDQDEMSRKRKKSTDNDEESGEGDRKRVGNVNLLANYDLSHYGLEMEQHCSLGDMTPDNISGLSRVTNIPQGAVEPQTIATVTNGTCNNNSKTNIDSNIVLPRSSTSIEPAVDQNLRSRSSTPDILDQKENMGSDTKQMVESSNDLSSNCNKPDLNTSNTNKTEEDVTLNQQNSDSTKNDELDETNLNEEDDDIDLLNQSKEVDWDQSFEEIPQQDIVTQQLQSNTTIDVLANLLQSEVQQMDENDDHFEDALDKTMLIANKPNNTKIDENKPDNTKTDELNQPGSSNQKSNESDIKEEINESDENVSEGFGTDDEDLLAENEIKTEPMEEEDNQDEGAPNDDNEEQNDKPGKSKDSEKGSDKNQPSTSGNNAARRDRCWYGSQCYRKNMVHKADYSHPGDADYDSDPNDPRPICSFGAGCYRKNKLHRQQFKHPRNSGQNPPKPPPDQKRQRKRRNSINNPTPDSQDDYDYSDPFIDDGSSDEYHLSNESESEEDDY